MTDTPTPGGEAPKGEVASGEASSADKPPDQSGATATPAVDAAAAAAPGAPVETTANTGAATAAADAAAAGAPAAPGAAAVANEVAAALAQADAAGAVAAPPAASAGAAATGDAAVDELLRQANFEDPISGTNIPPDIAAMATAAASAASGTMPDAQPFEMPNLAQAMREAQTSSIDLLRDVELNVKIELGRSRMLVEDVLKLGEGSVVELDKLAGDPVDVFVNDRLVARGEVLVLNDNFCVRVNEIVAVVKDDVI